MSVNGWSGSADAAAASELFALHRPKHVYATGKVDYVSQDATAATEAAALIAQLSTAAAGLASVLPRAVWHERYAALVAEGELPAPPLERPPDCGSNPYCGSLQ